MRHNRIIQQSAEAVSPKTQSRAVFLALPDYAEAACVFVGLEEAQPEGRKIHLLHDYADLKPAPGWHVVVAGKTYEVLAVAGRDLDCRETPAVLPIDDQQTH